MSNEELIAAALELAGKFYEAQGYTHRPGFKYYASPHPAERLMWKMACDAFEFIRGSDVRDALTDVEDDE
ncbi:hypothetical protein CS371_17755 (plasmid) [Serratia marcescens]|uniref:hypothetical protein n=1 Tax=Serratia TaxID=613 RepID=UPI000C1310EE|nr:hypothetical protein [Serratia marcescens]PHY81395.1 hypothetical protein CS371_17755 [Serratia marcescens]